MHSLDVIRSEQESIRKVREEWRASRLSWLLGAGCTFRVTCDGLTQIVSPYGGEVLAEERLSDDTIALAERALRQRKGGV